MDLDYAVYSVVAPMVFMILSQHSMGVCMPNNLTLDPQKYIAAQLDILLNGMRAAPGDARQGDLKA